MDASTKMYPVATDPGFVLGFSRHVVVLARGDEDIGVLDSWQSVGFRRWVAKGKGREGGAKI